MKELRFAKNLTELRKAKKFTQAKLAGLVGVDQRTVSAWEKGVCEPNLKTLIVLCEILDETVEGILF